MKPIPGAAAAYSVSSDGLQYTFTLHDNLKYSDGTQLTAKDFEYGWRRLGDPTLAGGYQFIGCELIAGFAAYAVTTWHLT